MANLAGRYATRQTQLYCCWQREVDTVAHESKKWEWGLREHTLSGILSLSFHAINRRTQRLVSYESDLLYGKCGKLCPQFVNLRGVRRIKQ